MWTLRYETQQVQTVSELGTTGVHDSAVTLDCSRQMRYTSAGSCDVSRLNIFETIRCDKIVVHCKCFHRIWIQVS